MGFSDFLKALSKASTGVDYESKNQSHSGEQLGFQKSGTPPKRDKQGRVIVTVKGGSPGAVWGVNLSKLDYKIAVKLAGKVNADEEFSKTIKVRVRPDSESAFANSILIETLDGEFIGWILKDASDDVVSVLKQITKAVVGVVPELGAEEFTFEMSARIEGVWDEVGEGDDEVWEADVTSMQIKMKNPAELDIP